jgi:magnesium transporter
MIGVLVPIVRTRFGKDPAMGSSVLLTFATDSLGFFIFLGLATVFLL